MFDRVLNMPLISSLKKLYILLPIFTCTYQVKSEYDDFPWVKFQNTGAANQRCSVRKGVLSNFTKIHRKTPVPGPIFNNVADLRPAALSKRKLWHRCFSKNFVKFL